ncbi:Holliday junction branch migration protein RuvA, partial [Desulfovibrio sp. OttesenSCG-928-O18]|nr:Holliday junction branch migration protein RuvA [Desulfovibrio sp. OttesenSCG-928-O18]
EVMEDACLLITSGGVGYEVFMPGHFLSRLPERGESVFCYTVTVVREDALELYGFATWDERQTFITLTSISRVGSKTGLAILSVFRPDDLRDLVANDDVTSLTRVPGIGKKTAQQLFLELKYKLKMGDSVVLPTMTLGAGGAVARDGVAGLVNLGYAEDEAARVVKAILAEEPDLDVSGLLRAALKNLGKGRA